ncbi:MAG: tRNA threonylcarbamoyladenosine dehydratase [Lachnospiraceae bacterium]|nr:tRNA threonylcarbamoyladenosine dehydratase [Lachnospiraceae bacterium]
MSDWLERTGLLLQGEALDKLKNAHVAIFGIGGVGGYVTEALARSGVGKFTLIDNDTVSVSNINRQIIATVDTIGRYKTDVMKERILSINPEAVVNVSHCFFLPGADADFLPLNQYSYVVDAIDTVSAKIELAVKAQEEGFRLISSMGTGNKLDPTGFQVADIYKTSVCPLAKVMRRELKARGVKKLKVVYSKEEPLKPAVQMSEGSRRAIPGSVSFVPPVAGLIIAGELIKDLIK